MTLLPKNYENAHSSINPNGSYTSLYAFSQLTNTIPSFTEYYSPSLNTISSVYRNLLYGASVEEQEKYAEIVIANSLNSFNLASLSSMDGTPVDWYPVYPTPVDWYDTHNPLRFSKITLNLTGNDTDDRSGPYRVLGDGNNNILSTLTNISTGLSAPLDKATSLKSAKFNYLEVRLNRHWLNFEVFNLYGWFINGQKSGYFSSGRIDNNQGVIPLITTSMLVAINVELAVEWSAKDQHVLDDAKQKREQIALGPFVTNSDSDSAPELHVIGWVSQLVPLAPQIGKG